MVLGYLSLALQRMRPLKAPVLVVAVSALLALLFTIATRPSAPEPTPSAGDAAMQLIDSEHDLVAASIRHILAADAAEQVADARRRAEMRADAVADAAGPKAPDQPAMAKADAVDAAARRSGAVIQPPLQLHAEAIAQPERHRPDRTPAVLAAVERIPQWLRTGIENVADWAAIPARALSRLPERRFL